MVQTILRLPAVLALRGRKRASHYNDIAAGVFTRPVKIGPNMVGWPESEVAALQGAAIAGSTPEQLRALVKRLEAQRKHAAVEVA